MGNVQVAGAAGGPWAVRFVGTLGGTPQLTMTGDGSGLTGGNMPGVAVSTVSQGGDAGRVQTTIDPRGLVTKTDYDLLGRMVRTIEAYANLAFSDTSDRTTEYTYDGDDHVLTLQADLGNAAFQRTGYVYGVTSGMGGTGSYLNSNDLLYQVQYPDPVTGLPSTSPSNDETYAYNALGQTISMTDRNGTTHAYSFDILGRTTLDAVTIPTGSNVDRHIQAQGTAYDTYGNPYLFTTYTDPAATMIHNQVERVFNGFGQLTNEYQSHRGAVNISQTPQVQYAYSFDPNNSNPPNHSRLVSMTYPNGRKIDYVYNTSSGNPPSLDDFISRLSAIADDNMGQPGQQLEAYAYLGLNTVVDRAHPQTGIDLTYINQPNGSTDGGDQYTGLDRFGRIIDQLWAPNTSLQTPTDRFQYGYDADSNVLYRNNLVNTSFGELYHLSGSQYGYDNFNQLTDFARGTLNSTHDGITGTPSETQDWTYDVLGNWNQVATNGVAQNRTHNAQNEITSLTPGNTPGYDSNGNTTQDDNGNVLKYDAWNRLVKVTTGGTPVIVLATYDYDALGRRIQRTVGQQSTDLYYSSAWQVLEEDQGGAMQVQYVWSPVYVDALVERDTAGGTRLYVQQDANYNVTALVGLVNGNWQVVQRFVYDPFGKPTVLDANFNATTDQYNWVYLHQGGRYDAITGLYYFRNRDYSPTLGRWLQVDPMGFGAGDRNPYRAEGNQPTGATDPIGLDFIAVADRALDVKGLGAKFRHYSLEYWISNANVVVGHQENDIPDFKMKNPGSTVDKAVELLADSSGWKVAAWSFKNPEFPKAGAWVVKDVSIAYIHYGDEKVEHFLVLFCGTKEAVKAKWELIDKQAHLYAYAEQPGFDKDPKGSDIKNWPNSFYPDQVTLKQLGNGVNNSNTFVRFVVTAVGLKMIEMSGSHPGRNTPEAIDRISKQTLIFSQLKPVKGKDPELPKMPPQFGK